MKKFIHLKNYRMNMRFGMLSFLFHRITGIALMVFLFFHIISMSTVHLGREFFEGLMKVYDTLGFHIAEYLLGLAVMWHVLNGIRISLIELFNLTHLQNVFSIVVWVLAVFGAIFSLPVFIPEIGGL